MIRKYLPFWGALAVLLGVFIWAEFNFAKSFQTCVSQERTYEASQSADEQSNPIPFPIRYTFTCSAGFIDLHNGFFTALSGLIIAAFTYTLWRSSDRQGDLARDAMIAGERAFIFAIQMAQYWERDSNTQECCWKFRPVWTNSGDTPTKNMTMHTAYTLRDSVLPPGFDFDYATTDIGHALIPPKININGGIAPQDAPVYPDELLAIQAGTKFLYLFGWAKYYDVFPETPEHITRFCWHILVNGDPRAYVPGTQAPNIGSLSFSFLYHAEGNCADDECG